MTECAFQCIQEREIENKIEAVVFDTTSSNSGCWKGSVGIFKKLVDRAMLWLACRHHISELHIKHANEVV